MPDFAVFVWEQKLIKYFVAADTAADARKVIEDTVEPAFANYDVESERVVESVEKLERWPARGRK